MKKEQAEISENYAFHFLDELEKPAVQMIGIGKETRCFETYHFDNRHRPSSYLFQYTTSGHGYLFADGQEYMLTPGQAFFLYMPGKEQYYYKEDSDEPWNFYYIMFRGDAADPYYKYVRSHLGMIHTFPEYHPAIQRLIRLHADASSGVLRDPFTVSSRVFEFLCCLCSNSSTVTSKYSALVTQAKAILEQDFANLDGISALAAKLNVSASHLSREFVREMGMPPVDYQRKLRLEKAVHLLSTTNSSVDEIAVVCGFSCGNYFDKVFKRYLKMSPRKFREYVQREGYRNVQL